MKRQISGYGQRLVDYVAVNGKHELHDVIKTMKEAVSGAETIDCCLEELTVDDDILYYDGNPIVNLTEDSLEKLCKIVRIPTAYMLRLNADMRKLNLEYWLWEMRDKEVRIVCKGGNLISIGDSNEVSLLDILDIVYNNTNAPVVFNTFSQTNSTVVDIYDESIVVCDGSYVGGLRIIHKTGLNAPEIVPIFIGVDDCGIIECSEYIQPMTIKNLSLKDILFLICDSVVNCIAAIGHLSHVLDETSSMAVTNAHRRIALYCREHNVPDRVRAYCVACFDESGVTDATIGDVIQMFSTIGYTDEIKHSSARKLQKIAGYILLKANNEHRCSKCDAKINED